MGGRRPYRDDWIGAMVVIVVFAIIDFAPRAHEVVVAALGA
jgi:drug/metabolite transporter superfamily protein YnfA